jgi:uncharacterized protein GlcG (DUF336 family)
MMLLAVMAPCGPFVPTARIGISAGIGGTSVMLGTGDFVGIRTGLSRNGGNMMRKQIIAALLAAVTLSPAARAQGVVMVPDVSYDMALVMATTAIEQCRSRGFAVGVSVVDRGGHVLVTLRDDAAAHHTVELAQRKAYTSRVFRQTTRAFSQRLIDNPISAGLGTTSGVVASLGGLPIKVGEQTIGGIGVSGAPGGENDEACAQAGIDKVADRLK